MNHKPVLRAMMIEKYGDERDLAYRCVVCRRTVQPSEAVLTCDGLKCINCVGITICRSEPSNELPDGPSAA